MQIEVIEDKHLTMLQTFCDKCRELGFENNSSFEAMKLLWCKSWGEYWCAVDNEEIIAVGGCHPLPEVSPSAWRILFRGCELPRKYTFKGLGKGDWNSITQREFIPLMIKYCPSSEIFLTTHRGGVHERNHRLMTLLSKQKDAYLQYHSTINLYYTEQTIWRVKVPTYFERRKKLSGTLI